jgi:glycosyltransferase involved in cell wall biosynthesis
MHVAIVTAGGAGMFCGSCMHDNAWARALHEAGQQVTLIPLYTPIRVDEADQSTSRIYFGGINVYLDQHLPGWRWLPRWFTRGLDSRRLLDWATQWGVSNNAKELGSMTVAMLRGQHGPQAAEGEQLVRFLTRELKPDLIVFSNAMLGAEVARLRNEFRGPIVCVLQGDDVFLDALVEPYRTQAFDLLRPVAAAMDGFIVHSRFYAEYMAGYLQIPPEKFHRLPLGIDCRGHTGRPKPAGSPRTIGYFARVAPEKGLREFVQAGLLLNRKRQDFRLVAGGYLQPHFQSYLEDVQKLAAPLGDRFRYVGSPDTVAEKAALLQTFDLLSVPTPYRDPKGLYVLEAWANGVPVVQPAHGHFPELMEEVGGGVCVQPDRAEAFPKPWDQPLTGAVEINLDLVEAKAFAEAWDQLLADEPRRLALAEQGWQQVRQAYDLPALAQASAALWAKLLGTQ